MNIRHATMADLEQLAAIEAASYPAEEGASKQSIHARLTHFADHFWLLEQQGEIMAFINGMVSNHADLSDEMYDDSTMHDATGDWQMIFSVVTAPAQRGKGYAAQLLQQVIDDSRVAQRKGIVLTCKANLLDFYAKFGFLDEGVSASTHGQVQWHQMRLRFE
ncbi:MAG: GNAT family N-acetyltransferase [Acinetobacter sp.]|nr:GNAT family N-acetyltransferase [Acinetobacter sp.]